MLSKEGLAKYKIQNPVKYAQKFGHLEEQPEETAEEVKPKSRKAKPVEETPTNTPSNTIAE